VVNNNAIIPSRGRILTIIGGNNIDHENNSQSKNYFQRVNSISMEGPYKKDKMVSSINHIFRGRHSTQRLSTYECYGNRSKH
jgi:hypothetical protein